MSEIVPFRAHAKKLSMLARKRLRRTLCFAFLTILLVAISGSSIAQTGSRLISANPHRLNTCPVTAPSQIPQIPIASNSKIDANAYHTWGPDSTMPTCIVDAVASATFASHEKPKIVASDGGKWTNQAALNWITTLKNAGAHYEHYDRYFDVSCTKCPNRGDVIDDATDFPASSHTVRQKLGQNATHLLPNGTLTRNQDKLHWTGNSSPITLMGYSWMGALAGNNFNIEGYLDVLQSYGINFTRVWAVEQWTGLAVDSPNTPLVSNDFTPFGGNLTVKWDLSQPSEPFFTRASDFAQAAADRGIVVQLSLFDYHGLLNELTYGRWLGSPYNKANNVNGFFDAGPTNSPPPSFLGRDGTAIGAINRAYIERVAQRLGGYGNVIFEIMNEPKDGDWADDEVWHDWVAGILRTEFAKTLVTRPTPRSQKVVTGGTAFFTVNATGTAPITYQWQFKATTSSVFVNLADNARISGTQASKLRIASITSADAGDYRCLVNAPSGSSNSLAATLSLASGGAAARDGFGAAEGTLVNGKLTETGGKVWVADNVKVSAQKAVSNAEAGEWRILAGVPISLSGLKTATVEADLRQSATGTIAVGFPAGSAISIFEQTNNSLWVEFTRAGLLSLKKTTGGAATTITTIDMPQLGFAIGNTVNIRLVYRTLPTPRADVYIDGVRRITNAPVGFSPTIQHAGFQAKRGNSTTPYQPADGSVDNFVVTLSTQ